MDPTAVASPGKRARARRETTPALALKYASPLVLLAVAAVTIAVISPGGHYGLLLALVPLLAASIYGVLLTAVIGAMSVGAFAMLRSALEDNGAAIWAIKLGLVTAAAVLGVVLSHLRIREKELRRSRDIALALQRGLLPRKFPDCSAVAVGHRYVPADSDAGVGGDWFDVIRLSGARVALVVGDVVGHGVNAAATMGRMRTALHTLADLDLMPDEVLARMDEMVQRMSHDAAEVELVASCLYMVYDPISRQCDIASAGHAPPVFVTPDGRVEVAAPTGNPPLGFGSAPFEVARRTLPEGTLIALYTDGLLGLRHREADQAIAGLAAAIVPADAPLQLLCDQILTTLSATDEDDLALLLARTRVLDPRHVAGWEFPASPEVVPAARAAVSAQLARWGLGESAFAIEMVVSELVTNAVRHAEGPVGIRLIRDDSLICEISDGSSTSPHPRHADPLDEGGRGLYLVGRLADRWGTRYTENGKTIWAAKDLGA
ncbi:Histidine kinase-like ATPase domain-containing protein [Streptomyces sp. DvalAA-14]|uniref:ATP-binding SpoIIE family protein phosphatase n=1 Tax=unclassified Streptomyces TaxID=2593676 RepID=UPI00081B8E07|nr:MULTISPECIES: ATP-binding SpoIIE family protein phosphatase [unclassified Streptomyces]MYS20989.1 SpoIIE family protein phosphatase [Streptomyces sp. SID4948]SCD81524.1 Histidine kinase-like ATPase domain-containing protein [Streptomyces sp. DvalAA-14]